MSLQIWLPLTKDARNQGLCHDTLTVSNVAFTTGGKLGDKYLSGGTITIPAATSKKIFNKTGMTFAFWLYPIGTSSSGAIMGQTAMSTGDNRMYTIFQYSTPTDLHLSWQDNTATNSAVFLGGSWSGFFPANTWTHCCVTYNGTKAIIYRNGQQYTTVNGTTNRTSFEYNFPINGSSIRKLNDVRIYNNCLSPEEVKKLAQGLMIHYPLSRRGFGTYNNIRENNIVNRGCTNFVHSDLYNEWSMTCPAGSSTWGVGITINNTGIVWDIGYTWVVSMEVYVPKAIGWQRDINNKPDVVDSSSYTGNDYDITGQRYAYTNGKSGQTLRAGWNKIWFSQTAPSTYGLFNYSTNWGIVTTNETDPINIKIRNIKGEIIPPNYPIQPTPWIPSEYDYLYYGMELLPGGYYTIYDCSGYNYNAWISIGYVNNILNTPKYCVSTTFMPYIEEN